MEKVPALDGLRGAAILLVLAYHFERIVVPVGPLASIIERGARLGWSGVDLFFVLSGFLITTILLETKGSKTYFRSFYARRVLRIFPLYYITLIIGLPVSILWYSYFAPQSLERMATSVPWLFLYLSNIELTLAAGWFGSARGFTHFWSLAVEEQFYLVWPAAVMMLSHTGLVRVIVAGLLLSPVLRLGLVLAENPLGAYVFTFARVDTLFVGALVAVVYLYHSGELIRLAVYLGVAGTVLLLTALWGSDIGDQMYLNPRVSLFGFSGFAFIYGALLIAALTSSRVRRTLSPAWLQSIGRLSYGMYVSHYILLQWYLSALEARPEVGFLGQVTTIAAATFLAYAIAAGFWHLIEKPFLAMKSRFPYHVPEKATVWTQPQPNGS